MVDRDRKVSLKIHYREFCYIAFLGNISKIKDAIPWKLIEWEKRKERGGFSDSSHKRLT